MDTIDLASLDPIVLRQVQSLLKQDKDLDNCLTSVEVVTPGQWGYQSIRVSERTKQQIEALIK